MARPEPATTVWESPFGDRLHSVSYAHHYCAGPRRGWASCQQNIYRRTLTPPSLLIAVNTKDYSLEGTPFYRDQRSDSTDGKNSIGG